MHNLYRTVKIHDRSRFEMLFKQARVSPRVRSWLATTRELDISESCAGSQHDPSIFPKQGSQSNHGGFLGALLLALGNAIPDVQAFTIQGLHRFMRPEFFRALPHFTSLKSLHLSFCKLNSLCQLGRIICAFPQLKHLSLEGWIIADQGSSNHTGVIHLQSWTNIRLQLLQITLDTSHEAEEYKTIIEWIVRSGICNSLEHLMVWAAGSRRLPLTLLLEAAGPSLIHYFEDKFPSRCHGTLIPSTALRFLDFSLHGGVIQGTGKSVDSWLRSRLARELRSVFSTVRSHQLEQVSIKTELPFHGSAHMGPQPQDVAGDPDLRDLHGTMGQPYFDMLKGVKVSVRVLYAWHKGRKLEVDEFDGKVGAMFRSLFQPWSVRGVLVDISLTLA